MKLLLHFSTSLFLVIILFSLELDSSKIFAQTIKAHHAIGTIVVDGVQGEEAWSKAEVLSHFIQFEPVYNEPSSFQTIVKVLYDNQKVYFAIECKDPEPDRVTAKLTKRDWELDIDDLVSIMLDTFDDNNNAYIFITNPLGTQKDGRIADNGRTIDYKWDQSWESAASMHSTGWTVEIAVPFKSLRYNAKNKSWGLNVGRRVARNREMSFIVGNLTQITRVSQFAALTDLNISDLSLKQYTLIPYAQAVFKEGEKTDSQMGLDVRYNVSSNFGIEATINPDFATIEGDVEQVNLTRFELSYPEKRPFFLEGAENYSTRIKQFYSRRIGDIPWGAKLDGKIQEWKLNALVTRSDPSTAGHEVDPGKKALYSVFRFNRELRRGSNIGVIGANRTYDGRNSGSVGLTATLFFTDVLGMTSQLIKSHGEADTGTWTYFIRPAYDSQFMHFHVRYTHVGENVMENMNPVGFIRDDDRKEIDSNIRRTFWINKYGIESIQPSINYNQYWSQKGVLRRWDDSNNLQIKFLKKWEYNFGWSEEKRLSWADTTEQVEKYFRNRLITNRINYDSKKGVQFSLSHGTGKNFNRDIDKITGGIDVKVIKGWNMEYQLTKHWFKPDVKDESNWIHYIRTSYYLNKDIFFKLFYQTKHRFDGRYSTDNFDLLRKTFQVVCVWRFLPPFGSIQFAYQEGTTRFTETDSKGRSFFTKLSWVL